MTRAPAQRLPSTAASDRSTPRAAATGARWNGAPEGGSECPVAVPRPSSGVYTACWRNTDFVTNHLIDLDEDALSAARAELGTTTIKDMVNETLRRATLHRERRVAAALDVLADADLDDRSEAWR